NPSPPDTATNVAANVVVLSWSGCGPGISNEVYIGTTPAPGSAEYVGTTTNCSWVLPLLAPNTTYYWRIAARKLGTTLSPVWRFTTRGVQHFDLSTVSSPQFINQPFSLTVTA